jgi:hypothetical protein
MVTTATSRFPPNAFPFAKQSLLLSKPEVISRFYTGIIPVVFTVNAPLKHGIFVRILTVLVDNLHLTNIINL